MEDRVRCCKALEHVFVDLLHQVRAHKSFQITLQVLRLQIEIPTGAKKGLLSLLRLGQFGRGMKEMGIRHKELFLHLRIKNVGTPFFIGPYKLFLVHEEPRIFNVYRVTQMVLGLGKQLIIFGLFWPLQIPKN